jgi:signal transduction histidine kinase
MSLALRNADRQKSDFLAVLAHELRNPLTPLVTGLQLLRNAPGNQAVVDRTGKMMQRQLDHMVRLIDELMDVARIDSGKVRLTRVRTELSVVVRSALESSMPLIEQRGHALALELPPEPIWLDIDPTRMVQVLANLLNNAAKYTPPGGKLALAIRREADDVVIAVTDNGVGIEAGALHGVFDLFSQVASSSDMAQGGLGIGLALVQQLVHLHGGKVTVRSEGAGCGCVFTVRLSSTPARKYEPQPLPTVAVRSWRTGDGVGRPGVVAAQRWQAANAEPAMPAAS